MNIRKLTHFIWTLNYIGNIIGILLNSHAHCWNRAVLHMIMMFISLGMMFYTEE